MSRRVVVAAAMALAVAAVFPVRASDTGATPAGATPAGAKTAAVAPDASPEPAPSVEAGRRAYVSSCTRCHGIHLVVSSSAFFDLRTFPKDQKERFVSSVTNGVRQMPAWGSLLKPGAVESLWLYVGSVNGW